jgi:hypothetical protein
MLSKNAKYDLVHNTYEMIGESRLFIAQNGNLVAGRGGKTFWGFRGDFVKSFTDTQTGSEWCS